MIWGNWIDLVQKADRETFDGNLGASEARASSCDDMFGKEP